MSEGDPPFWARSLPDSSEALPYKRYRVAQSFTADSSRIAPWFDKPGGSMQVDLGNGSTTVQTLINNGILEEIP